MILIWPGVEGLEGASLLFPGCRNMIFWAHACGLQLQAVIQGEIRVVTPTTDLYLTKRC